MLFLPADTVSEFIIENIWGVQSGPSNRDANGQRPEWIPILFRRPVLFISAWRAKGRKSWNQGKKNWRHGPETFWTFQIFSLSTLANQLFAKLILFKTNTLAIKAVSQLCHTLCLSATPPLIYKIAYNRFMSNSFDGNYCTLPLSIHI